MVRAPFFDKNGVKKGAWSLEEDEKLRAYVEKYGHWNWRELPKFAGLSRCGKSCRLRWMNYLRPGVKHGNYSKQEEDLIIKLHEQFGNKWSKIAAKLPGRTDNEIKNYWHTHLKKVTKQSQSQSIEQSTETFQYEDMTENRDTKVKNFVKQTPLPILESCPLSPEPTSSELTHLTSPDSSLVTSCNWPWIAEDSHSSFETLENTSGDFWTQPFVADQDGYKLPVLEGGNYYISPYFTYYEDGTDLFYQVMQELSGN